MLRIRGAVPVLLAGLFCACMPAPQNSPRARELAALVRERVQQRRAVGLAVGVIEADGTTRMAFAGSAGGTRPLDGRSLFEIGSITKTFTGVLLAEMARTGEVRFDDPISRYLPDSVRVPSRNGRQITLLDLATHRSGLPGMPDNIRPADRWNYLADYSVEQMYEFLSRVELRSDPGTSYGYSNYGSGLLGHILSRAAGEPYEQLVRERILVPLRMRSTAIELRGDLRDRMTRGHNLQGTEVAHWDLPTLAGAGAFRSDLEDMMRYLAASLKAPGSDVERSLHEALRSQGAVTDTLWVRHGIHETGLGWHIRSVGASRIVWKDGGTGGYQTFIGFDPVRGVGAVVLSNTAIEVDDIGFHLIDPKLPLEAPRPMPLRIEVPESVLRDYVGEYAMTPERTLIVTREGGDLFLHEAADPEKLRMVPEAENRFFLEVANVSFTFVRDASGTVSGAVVSILGEETTAPRVR